MSSTLALLPSLLSLPLILLHAHTRTACLQFRIYVCMLVRVCVCLGPTPPSTFVLLCIPDAFTALASVAAASAAVAVAYTTWVHVQPLWLPLALSPPPCLYTHLYICLLRMQLHCCLLVNMQADFFSLPIPRLPYSLSLCLFCCPSSVNWSRRRRRRCRHCAQNMTNTKNGIWPCTLKAEEDPPV